MKKILFLAIFFTVAQLSFAQFGTCTPDPTFADSSAGVYPLPYEATTYPDGGIPVSACINKPFQFVFNVRVSDSITSGAITVPLDSIVLNTTGAVTGLPVGMSYACNPPSCHFQKNTVGCAVIYGTATASNPVGDYSLVITGKASALNGFFVLDISFPGQFFPGSYTLKLEEENSANCSFVTTSVEELGTADFAVTNRPNPFSSATEIRIFARNNEDVPMRVFDGTGREIYKQNLKLESGENFFQFDGASLPNGIYTYTIGKGAQISTQRMVIQH